MALPGFLDPSYQFTLVANTPVTIPVPKSSKTAVFTSTGVFWAQGGQTASSSASAFTAGTAVAAFADADAGDPTGLQADAGGYQVVDVGGAVAGSDATGLANDATVYTASVVVDGVTKPIAVTGSTAQTYTTLLSELNTDLGASATAALVGGNVRITSATTGPTSTIAITDTDLFSTLTDYVAIDAAVVGTDELTYTATLTVAGTNYPIIIGGNSADTFANLLIALNADAGGGLWTNTDPSLTFTTTLTGATQTIGLVDGDTNPLFASITGFASITLNGGGLSEASKMSPEQLRTIGSNFLTIVSTGTPTVNVTFSTF